MQVALAKTSYECTDVFWEKKETTFNSLIVILPVFLARIFSLALALPQGSWHLWCDVFVLNEKSEVLIIQRADNGFWAMPGGCHDLGETPKACAERECREESGYVVIVTDLLGVFSSNRYEYINYPWKENEFCHLLFRAEVVGGEAKTSSESLKVGWFDEGALPKFSDGHEIRVRFGFKAAHNPNFKPYFE
ncbi:MAG: NUDIX domain-containing protein [Bacteriovorax sp.]